MSGPGKLKILDRLRARYGWFDHVMRANQRFNEAKGNHYAAGLAYYTIFAVFPLSMVVFAASGFLLSRQPELLAQIDNRIKGSVSGDPGRQLIKLMNSAVDSRTSIGVIGLGTAGWVGLSWISHLRDALGEMCKHHRAPHGFVRTKLADLAAMASMFAAILATVALSALAGAKPMATLLARLGIYDFPLLDAILRGVSVLLSVLVSWLLFTWLIFWLPRGSIGFASSVRAGLLTAVAFEVFKLVASLYLRSVLHSPAGATFGPVLGLMVFAYITARLVLFATAWAATSPENRG
jgi:membrane protein